MRGRSSEVDGTCGALPISQYHCITSLKAPGAAWKLSPTNQVTHQFICNVVVFVSHLPHRPNGYIISRAFWDFSLCVSCVGNVKPCMMICIKCTVGLAQCMHVKPLMFWLSPPAVNLGMHDNYVCSRVTLLQHSFKIKDSCFLILGGTTYGFTDYVNDSKQ